MKRSFSVLPAAASANVLVHLRFSFWLLAFFFVWPAADSQAESSTLAWTQSYNGPFSNGADTARVVKVDAAGDVIVAGASQFSSNGSEIYTAKYSGVSGQLIWSRRSKGGVTSTRTDTVNAMALDATGNVILAGYTTPDGSLNSADGYVAKYAAATGAVLWERVLDAGQTRRDTFSAVGVDASGNVFVAGTTRRNDFSPVDNDFYTIKLAGSDGQTLWSKLFDLPGANQSTESAFALAVDDSDNLFVTGGVFHNGSGTDTLTIKYAGTDGVVLWQQRLVESGLNDDNGQAIVIDPVGDVIVASSTTGTDAGIRTIKYAGDTGQQMWKAAYAGGAGTDVVKAVAVDAAGNAVITADVRTTGSGEDFYTAKYAFDDGRLLWQRSFDGGLTGGLNKNDIPAAVAVDVLGNVIVAGNSNGPNSGQPDIYFAKYAASTGAILWEQRYVTPLGHPQTVGPRGLATGLGYIVVAGSNAVAGTSDTYFWTMKYQDILPPLLTATAVLDVDVTAATVNGTVNPVGLATSAYFIYGTSPTLTTGTSTTPPEAVGSGFTPVELSHPFTGLNPQTLYYYRLVAENAQNPSVLGPILSFTTDAPPVLSLPAAGVKVSHALLVAFELPEAALAGSVKLALNDGISSRVLVLNAANSSAGAHAFTFDPAAPGASGQFSLADPIPDGSYTVTVEYQDTAAHLPRPSAPRLNVTIDSTAPVLTLPTPITVEAQNANGASVNFAVSTIDNLDPAPALTVSPESGSVFPIGTTLVNVSTLDWAGNTRAENFTVTVQDTTQPVVVGNFAPLALITGENGSVPLPDYLPQATVTDAVGVIGITQDPPAGSPRPAGMTTVTVRALDAAGNIGSFSFDVAVADGTKPDIAAPAGSFTPPTLTTGADATVALVDYTAQAITSDNVGVTAVTQLPAPGTPLVYGTTAVTLTAHDAAGNTRDLSFDVPVLDGTNPTIAAPLENFAPLGITTGVDGTVALPDYTAQAVTGDNVAVTTVTQVPVPGSPRLAGVTTVTLTAHDAAGNTKDVSFDVAVADGTKPDISTPVDGFAPLSITAENDGTAVLPDYTAQAVTSDNVGVTSVTQVPAPGSVRLFGKTTITLTAHDVAGNSRDLSFDIFVALDNPLLNTVATTGGAVPGAGVDVRIPADAIFTSVGIPAMDDARGVAFLGKWISAAGLGSGIFAGNPPVLIMAAGEDATGIAGAKFKSLNDPVVAPDGSIAFGATVTGGGIRPANDQGVWLTVGGAPTLMLREGFDTPGLPPGMLLKSVLGISLRDHRMLALVSLSPAKGLVTAGNDTVLLRFAAGEATLLLREGELLDFQDGNPATAVKAINVLLPATGSIAHGRWQTDHDAIARVAFTNQRTALLRFPASGAFTRLLATNDPMPALGASTFWSSLGLPAIETGGGAVVLKGTLNSLRLAGTTPPVTAKSDTVLAFDDANSADFTIFAREGEGAPGVGAPAVFSTFLDPVVNANGDVAFLGTLAGKSITTKNKTGLWWGLPDAPALLARTGNAAPDGNGASTTATWTKFTSLALPDGPDAGPVFVAGLAGPGVTAKNNRGVWAVDSTGLLRGDLLRTGDIVDGKPVIGINALTTVPGALGASRGYNARGAVVARVLFAKGGQSIVRIDVPEGKGRLISTQAMKTGSNSRFANIRQFAGFSSLHAPR